MPTVGRGRSHLQSVLKDIPTHYGTDGSPWKSEIKFSVSVGVEVDKVALPEVAGVVKPEDFLCKERLEVYNDLASIIGPPHLWSGEKLNPAA